MRKILHLALGGTIACVKTPKGLIPKLKSKELLTFIDLPSGVEAESIDFLKRTIVFPEDWVALSKKIFSLYGSYDGFVVTLGTDTLAFVSSALSLMLQNLSKPVVLTGAMEAIQSPHSSGRRNLRDAFVVVAEKHIGGVLVVFHGKIFDGRCISKVRSDALDAFESINAQPLGSVTGNRIKWGHKPICQEARLCLKTNLDMRVVIVKLTPQIDPGFLKSLSSYNGIVIEGYGDGNVPSNLVPVLSSLAKRRIVILASQCPYGRVKHRYEGGAALIKNGAFSSRGMTKEMACVKLVWALGQSRNRRNIFRLLGFNKS